MKSKKTKWYCIDCGYTEANNKHMDGCKCPKCNSKLFVGKLVGKEGYNGKIMYRI